MNSTGKGAREADAADMAKANLKVRVLMDDTQLVGENLGVKSAGEVFVINPKAAWKVAYHGPAKADLMKEALDAVIADRAVKTPTAPMSGTPIAFPLRDKAMAGKLDISYAKDIVPILETKCVACHTQGGIGPFAMNSYEMVKGYAPMIREVVRTSRMPPWHADPAVGKFHDDRSLTTEQKQTLVHWIEAGAPRGAGEDRLTTDVKPAPEWPLGTPDMIVELPAYAVPASGIVDYQNPVVKNPLTEGRWMRASTVKVGDRKAVHHVLSPVGGYAVGAESSVYPEGTGAWLEPGQPLHFQLHYTTYGKASTDVTKVGVYFYPKDKPPTIIRRSAVILDASLEIPAGEARHEEIAYLSFPKDATMYGAFPHAHYRGENMTLTIRYPDGKEKLLLSLPKYDFNWQRGYEFETPVAVPAGSKLITRYQYDNSANNVANPDPTINVKWGEQSFEEMVYTAISFRWNDETVANKHDEYMTQLRSGQLMGMLDDNLDGKIQKTELRGRMADMIAPNWDKLDKNHDGVLDADEFAPVAAMFSRRLRDAEDQSVKNN